jgi:UDP-GlcNAc3NAcA epimerase
VHHPASRLRVTTVVGARPQFIKAAVLSRALADAGVAETLVHTGQHFDGAMSDVFFQELDLPTPKHHLGFGGLGHGAMTGRMLEAIERLLLADRPDWVLVYGDTNSTLAGALAAVKLHIPVAHVEAGMRSFNRAMPEEINRVLTDHVATANLVTNTAAQRHLASEGITVGVHVVGDVMLDACKYYARAARAGVLPRLGLKPGGFALATVHRAENTDSSEALLGILKGLEQVGEELPVVLATHPRTRKALRAAGANPNLARVLLIEPIGYLEMLELEANAALILTDSGGVQKEAFYHRVPCVTLRDETEWRETVDLGWNRLAGGEPSRIVAAAKDMLTATRSEPPPVYGDGTAALQITHVITRWSNATEQPRPAAAST